MTTPTHHLHTPEAHEKNNRAKVVGAYLRFIDQPKRSRAQEEQSRKRRAKLNEQINKASGVAKLRLIQERLNVERKVVAQDRHSVSEERFIEVCAAYSQENGISWSAWREIGVSEDVLRRAGLAPLTQGRKKRQNVEATPVPVNGSSAQPAIEAPQQISEPSI